MKYTVKTKPDFLIIGSMKSGTTTLYSDLSEIKSLHLPSDKEPAILASTGDVEVLREKYKKHFRNAKEGQLCGEASTVYTSKPMYDNIAERASALCGKNLRLIMIMRDPVERIYSHLRHDVAGGHVNYSEMDKVVLEDERYLAVSNYAMQLEPWVKLFGRENVYCISFNEYKYNRTETIRDTAKFLGIDHAFFAGETLDVKNRSDELLQTGKVVGKIIKSRMYRDLIRPVFPDNLRIWARSMLLTKAGCKNVVLSPSTDEQLREKLKNVEKEVEDLLGRRISINAGS